MNEIVETLVSWGIPREHAEEMWRETRRRGQKNPTPGRMLVREFRKAFRAQRTV